MAALGLVFMGTPEFAVPALEALVAAGHDMLCVYSQPPRPSGRGHRTTPSPVQARAEALGLEVRTPKSLKPAAEQEAFAALRADAAVVAAYGLILPPAMLRAPRLGCLNIHASLLPRWRGAAPIPRAILAGDAETGVSIMWMEEGLDTGPVLLAERLEIPPDTTAGSLHDALAALGARLVVDALEGLAAGRLEPTPQPAEGATYAKKLSPAEARLDWRRPAAELARRVRAMAPRPGAWFEAGGERLKVLEAKAVSGRGAPGTVLDERATVSCGEGALRLLRLQRQGKAAMPAEALLRGFALTPGDVLPATVDDAA